jgi:hypothetical protein
MSSPFTNEAARALGRFLGGQGRIRVRRQVCCFQWNRKIGEKWEMGVDTPELMVGILGEAQVT